MHLSFEKFYWEFTTEKHGHPVSKRNIFLDKNMNTNFVTSLRHTDNFL